MDIHKSALFGDPLDGKFRAHKQMFGVFDAAAVDILGQRNPQFFGEQSRKIVGVDIEFCCQ